MAKQVVIRSSAHDGYRRAGLALARGHNEFPLASLSREQLETLKGDPRLAVMIEGSDDKPAKAEREEKPVPPEKPKAKAPEGKAAKEEKPGAAEKPGADNGTQGT